MPTRQTEVKIRKQAPAKTRTNPSLAVRAEKPLRTPKAQRSDNAPKRETLNFRIKGEDRALIDRAASLSGKSRTDFLLEAGRRAATDTLLDRTFFQADPAAFAAFTARLDAPPRPNDRLKRMLQEPAPWDK